MNMKIAVGAAVILAVIYFFPAFKHMQSSRAISGGTTQELKKSAMNVRRTMSTNDRNSFDMAFGILEKLKSEEGPEAFPNAIDGLDPDQIVALAKQEVDTQIAAGNADFKQYTSWDDMITKLSATTPKKGAQAAAPAPLRQSDRPSRPE